MSQDLGKGYTGGIRGLRRLIVAIFIDLHEKQTRRKDKSLGTCTALSKPLFMNNREVLFINKSLTFRSISLKWRT